MAGFGDARYGTPRRPRTFLISDRSHSVPTRDYAWPDGPRNLTDFAGSRVTDGPCRSAIIAGSGRRSARSRWIVLRRAELHRRHQTFVVADPSSPAPVVRAVTREMAPSP